MKSQRKIKQQKKKEDKKLEKMKQLIAEDVRRARWIK